MVTTMKGEGSGKRQRGSLNTSLGSVVINVCHVQRFTVENTFFR